MLDQEGYLSFFERYKTDSEISLMPGKRIFYSEPGAYDRKNKIIDSTRGSLRLNTDKFGHSGRRKIAFGDWDKDGDIDIIVNSLNAALIENTGMKDQLVEMKLSGNFSDQKLAGHTTSPTLVHWNKNKKPDLLLGAEDGCFYYLKNE